MNVGHHSLLTLAIQRQDSPTGIVPQLALANLLHDSPEGFLRFDALTPIKPLLGPGFEKLNYDLQVAIHRRFGLPPKLPLEWKRAIKSADRKAAAAEALHIAGWSRREIKETLGIPLKPLERDPLHGDPPWRPMSSSEAAERLYDMLMQLLKECSASPLPGEMVA